MTNKLAILLSSAGRRNQLAQCLREDAGLLGRDLLLLGADLRPKLSSACQFADLSFEVPRCLSAEYVPALLEICRKHQVRLLIPTIDTELEALSRHAVDFSRIGTRVVVSRPEVVAMARDKAETVRFLNGAGVSAPRTLCLAEYLEDPGRLPGPVIAKPRGGSSSMGIVRGSGAADFGTLAIADYLVQALWQGKEYTVNLFFDEHGKFRCAVPHLRLEVRGGEVSKGRTEHVPALEAAAEKIAAALLGARGPLCFQAIVTEAGEYAVFEINARFGGGYPLAHRAGARFSQWLLEEAAGLPSSANNNWKEGVTMLRYDSAVFLND